MLRMNGRDWPSCLAPVRYDEDGGIVRDRPCLSTCTRIGDANDVYVDLRLTSSKVTSMSI